MPTHSQVIEQMIAERDQARADRDAAIRLLQESMEHSDLISWSEVDDAHQAEYDRLLALLPLASEAGGEG